MLDEILEYFRPSRQKRHAAQQRKHILSDYKNPKPVKRKSHAAQVRRSSSSRVAPVQHSKKYQSREPDWERRSLWQAIAAPTEINTFLAMLYFGVLVTIVFLQPAVFNYPRWEVMMDLSRDGVFTITDLFYWCFWLFYLPGDVVISVMMQLPGPSTFFELRGDSFGGIGSLLMSALYWWLMGGGPLLFAGMAPIFIQTFLRNTYQ